MRRRNETAQLWLTLRHAHGSDDGSPDAVLPPLPDDTTAAIDDDRDPGFDPVALVRRTNQERG